jgi:hypothetical protein
MNTLIKYSDILKLMAPTGGHLEEKLRILKQNATK